ncbi:MAG: FAD-dependent monooxygenase [Proteobacteria bacterium]|nr:FAD-dependent monooxygenase [Pseudomonadota bacterium]HQR04294.1 FAD-dependent monooxygenase [Rhodocyclaceae bacterium]
MISPDAEDRIPVAIVGGGPAGMALALALQRAGIGAAIFDAREQGAGAKDSRVLALSHGSRQTLEWMGVWSGVAATPITTIHISQRGGLGRTRITAAEHGLPALGYVAPAASLIEALGQAIATAGIPFHARSPVEGIAPASDHIAFTAGGQAYHAALLAFAEGAVDAAAATAGRDYGQHAVLCDVHGKPGHAGCAWERFTPDGPLALLPHGERLSVVYTCAPSTADLLLTLDDAAFLSRLQAQFGARLRFSAVGPRTRFPLGLRYRRQVTGDRQVWLGNAAQTLHPVAGQGYNLCLRDVRMLARILTDAPDPGDPGLLARYGAGRRRDRAGTIGFTDSLVRIFSNDIPLLRHARGAGLLALDLLPALRGSVARRMIWGIRGS